MVTKNALRLLQNGSEVRDGYIELFPNIILDDFAFGMSAMPLATGYIWLVELNSHTRVL